MGIRLMGVGTLLIFDEYDAYDRLHTYGKAILRAFTFFIL